MDRDDGFDEARLEWHKRMALSRGETATRTIPPNQHTLKALQDPVTRLEDCPRFEFPRKHELHSTDPLCRHCGFWMKEI